jgi:membrane protein
MTDRLTGVRAETQAAGRVGWAFLRDWLGILRQAVKSWRADRAPSMGAAIAYYTVFSLAPILVLIVAIAGLVFGKQAAEGALFQEIAALVGPESAGAVQALIKSASGTRSGIVASVLGIGALVVAATGVFGELQVAFNVIWKAGPPADAGWRHLLKDRLRSLALILAIGLLMLVSLAAGAALAALDQRIAHILPILPYLLHGANLALSLAFTAALFAMMFKILPDIAVAWGDVWFGATATALLFTVGKFFIGFYIGGSGVKSTYHAVGALALLLVWIYYSAQILLFGAEFAKAHGDHLHAKRAAAARAT